MSDNPETKPQNEAASQTSKSESGGQGRIDEVGTTGVYPGSGPWPSGSAEIRTPGTFVQGQRDEQGREVEGGSEPIYWNRETLLGGATPPPSGPPQNQVQRPTHSGGNMQDSSRQTRSMSEVSLTIPQIALIAGTRGLLGAGVGLLLAERLPSSQRKAVGWTLFLVGALTTIPLALEVFGSRRVSDRGRGRSWESRPDVSLMQSR